MDGMAGAVPSIFRLTAKCLVSYDFPISIGAKKLIFLTSSPLCRNPDFLNCPSAKRAAPQAARGRGNELADTY
jgi:hypothetical protein